MSSNLITILTGDCREVLKTLPDESVHCCVTSPPYWGLRDYGTASWEGGDPECEHLAPMPGGTKGFQTYPKANTAEAVEKKVAVRRQQFQGACRDCGAVRIDHQIGLEKTPQEFVESMVQVFREVRRVLKADGTLWLNLGDSYANDGKWGGETGGKAAYLDEGSRTRAGREKRFTGLKPKDLVGIPWMVAFALRADGWYLRRDIIWNKPNPMPESVTDRPTTSHEYIFLLSKSERYFYDAEAIKEPCESGPSDIRKMLESKSRIGGKHKDLVDSLSKASSATNIGDKRAVGTPDGRNKRSVWTVASAPYKESHFATYPPALIKPCILAGTRTAGKRCDCAQIISTPTGTGDVEDPTMETGRSGMNRPRREDEGTRPVTRRQQRHHAALMKESPHRRAMELICGDAFAHYIRTDASEARPLPPNVMADFLSRGWITDPSPECGCPIHPADTVLDPFGGSGTTGMVAAELGRKAILIELNEKYTALIHKRTDVTPGLPL